MYPPVWQIGVFSQCIFPGCLHQPGVTLVSFLMIVAVILSLVSLLLIAFSHLATISLPSCLFSCITLSHLRTHIRWAASDISIWSSLVAPFCVTDVLNNAYYTVMTTVVSSNESWTDSVRDAGVTWSRPYCCKNSHRRHPRNPVLG